MRAKGADTMWPVCPIPPLGTPLTTPTGWPPTGQKGTGHLRPHTGQRARPPADFGPYWPLRDGVEAYARPHRRGGAATIHLCSLQIAELTPIFGFRLKKKLAAIYLSLFPTANCRLPPLCSRLKRLGGRSVTEEDRGANFLERYVEKGGKICNLQQTGRGAIRPTA